MYSILLKVSTSQGERWKYLLDDEGEIYTEDELTNVQTKVVELLNENLLSNIKVVKNCIITSTITVEEVEI